MLTSVWNVYHGICAKILDWCSNLAEIIHVWVTKGWTTTLDGTKPCRQNIIVLVKTLALINAKLVGQVIQVQDLKDQDGDESCDSNDSVDNNPISGLVSKE